MPSGGLSKLQSEDWPWWRGPQRDGIVRQSQTPPTKWSATEGIVWTADVPGRGNGSAIVVGDRVILATCDEASGSQSVLAYDRKSGKQLFQKVIHTDGAMRKNNRSTGASSTPASDGERIYINFANHDAAIATALTMDGEVVWQTSFSEYRIHQGFGASPALYKDLVLVVADGKGGSPEAKVGGAMAAINRTNGKIVWKRERPSAPQLSFAPSCSTSMPKINC